MRSLRIHPGVVAAFCLVVSGAVCAEAGDAAPPVKLTVEPGHPWTPPFGLERVGRPMEAVVEVPPGAKPAAEYVIVAYRDGKETSRRTVTPVVDTRSPQPASGFGRVVLEGWPSEVALVVKADAQARPVEVARAQVKPPALEAAAVARPDTVIHPVDLGTILVPADWLLLAGGQRAEVEVAALGRGGDLSGASAVAWYQSAPDQRVKAGLALRAANRTYGEPPGSSRRRGMRGDKPRGSPALLAALSRGHKARATLAMGPASRTLKRDALHVAVVNGAGKELWRKDIRVMLVPDPPKWPAFGAVQTKLRYDAPIPVAGGKTLHYDEAWDPKLRDVVVFFPNGARFVFWRGSSYIPFWAGRFNTGFCYEWAERGFPPSPGARDCQEPLQDKELRYGRVAIVESTAARAHVRWDYQSCDLDYRVWGDFATEDYCFYPDGFGTRVLTLTAIPEAEYELNEFIVFTPQAALPWDVLPANLLDILWGERGKIAFSFPWTGEQSTEGIGLPIYRIRLDKHDRLAAFQFCPWGAGPIPPGGFGPKYERGAAITPSYWGYHWPLSRGFSTVWQFVSDQVPLSPAHNSLCSAGRKRPTPLRSQVLRTRDALGQTKTMKRETWVWLIGMTDAGDDQLRQWARSFAHPPKLEARGAEVAPQPYAPERRALRLTVQSKTVAITITPAGCCVNPVFELKDAPETLSAVRLDDRPLAADRYRWDGATLWLSANLDRPATLKLEFADAGHRR